MHPMLSRISSRTIQGKKWSLPLALSDHLVWSQGYTDLNYKAHSTQSSWAARWGKFSKLIYPHQMLWKEIPPINPLPSGWSLRNVVWWYLGTPTDNMKNNIHAQPSSATSRTPCLTTPCEALQHLNSDTRLTESWKSNNQWKPLQNP